jgi:sterol desaturase/sphingolipid hydroxylase (fatty acid hydroxylase superfamily)
MQLRAPVAVEGMLATLVTMLAIDFSSYTMHRLLHRVGPLWRLHAVHHAATCLTPFTTYRQHPLEPLLLNGARAVAAAIGLAMFHWVFVQRTPVVTIYGLGAGFFAYMFTVNLHHAPVPLRYPRWLRYALISPHVHHLHHSTDVQHRHCNFGVVFSVWDRAFGSYFERDFATGELRFGLGDADPFAHSLRASLLLQPLLVQRAADRGLPAAAAAGRLSRT